MGEQIQKGAARTTTVKHNETTQTLHHKPFNDMPPARWRCRRQSA